MGNYYFTATDLTPFSPSSVAATVRGSLITHQGNTQIDHHRGWISDALHTSILLKKVLDSRYLTWIQGLYIYDSFLVTDQTGQRVMSTPPASPSRAEQTVCSPEGKMWPIKKEIEKNPAWKTFNTVRMCLGMPRLGSGMFALLFPFCNWPNATARYFHCSLNGVLCRSNTAVRTVSSPSGMKGLLPTLDNKTERNPSEIFSFSRGAQWKTPLQVIWPHQRQAPAFSKQFAS